MTYRHDQWDFRPHRLIVNSHAQTILGIRWPREYAPYQAKQHQIVLDDGDRLVLHEDQPVQAEEGPRESVLLIHGLGGCHQSTYMCRMTEKLVERGYRVFRLDMRGCGAGEGLAKLPTHSGRSDDIAAALYFMAELHPESPASAVGFSLGGTQTLNMLAEAGETRIGNLQRSLVICPPLQLVEVEQHFRTLLGKRYDNFFVKLLWKQILDRWQLFPELAPASIPRQPRRLREIDEMVIAPSGGFKNAEDYYLKTSPGPKLASIRQPVTIFSSEDDPVVPVRPLLELPISSSVEVITTPRGGHLGFLAGRNDDPDRRWLDWRIIDWLEAGRTSLGAGKGGERILVSHTRVRRDGAATPASGAPSSGC